jgi:peptidoglycan hydrolase-like protein with peptidoglycan-binding domain
VQANQAGQFDNLNAITVSAWVYPKAVWGKAFTYIRNQITGSGGGFGIGGSWDGTASSRIYIGSQAYDFSGVAEPAVDRWTHIAFTYDVATNKIIFYKNSTAATEKTGPGTPIPASTQPFVVGKSGGTDGSSYKFNGFIDDVRVYNRALTAAEISAIYSGVPIPVQNPSDTTAPSVPTGLAVTSTTNTSATMSWSPSTDAVGVTGYKVYRNNVQVSVVTSGTSYTDSGLTAGSTYLYQVMAFDAAGNTSALSNSLPVTTTGSSATSFGTTQIDLPSVIRGRQAYANQHMMWKDPSGVVHMVNSFGGADVRGDEKAYLHYINTSTGASALVEGGMCSMGRNNVYDPVHNKLYWYGEYCSYQYGGSFNEFDPVTMTNTVIRNGGSTWWAGQSMTLGEDNKIYFSAIHAYEPAHLYSYDPAVGASSWTDLGAIYDKSNGNGPSVYVDTTHAYVAWGDSTSNNYMHLMIRPLASGGTWSEFSFPDGIIVANRNNMWIGLDNATKKPFLYRNTPAGVKYYWLQNGTATAVAAGTVPHEGYGGAGDLNKRHLISMMAYNDYNGFVNAFGYDMNWDLSIPNLASPVSTVAYGPHSTWNYPSSGFRTSSLTYTGPWYDMKVSTIAPVQGDNRFIAVGDVSSLYDYGRQSITPFPLLSPISAYTAMRVPAALTPSGTDEIYLAGYPNRVMRWIPTQAMSSRQANTNPVDFVTSEHMNYRYNLAYDSTGTIWTGGNACGATPGCIDYGGVAWYNPATKASGEIFAGVWTGGNPPATGNSIKFTSMTVSNNRTKLVVSSNDGKLTVVNTQSKAVEGSYNLGVGAFMVEVSDDRVIGVTSSADPSGPRVFLFKPSDRTMVIAPQPVGVTGLPFGATDGRFARMVFSLERGPDGYAWLHMSDKIYRINPTTLEFQYVITNTSDSRRLAWSYNGVDLIAFGGSTTSYFPNILSLSQAQIAAIPTGTVPSIPGSPQVIVTPSPQPPVAPTTYTVTVARAGDGSGSVSGGSINCGSSCTTTVTSGASVSLTATPASGSTFTGWTGACSGIGVCSVAIFANTSIGATFTLATSQTPQTPAPTPTQTQTQNQTPTPPPTQTQTPAQTQNQSPTPNTQTTAANQQSQPSTSAVQSPAIGTTNPVNGVTTAPQSTFTRTLAVGSSGADVKLLQIVLNNTGVVIAAKGAGSVGNESTYFGPATRSALLKFQRARGLAADGQLNTETVTYVNKMVTNDPAKLVPKNAPATSNVSRTTASIRRGLAQGAVGEDVRTLQILLNSNGIVVAQRGLGSRGNESTVFGPSTKNALIRFQRTYRIPATGYVDAITLKKLAQVTGR